MQKNYLVFDVESIGLHGHAFAVGWVLITPQGDELESGLAYCDPRKVKGTEEDHIWVAENVPSLSEGIELEYLGAVRKYFWNIWMRLRESVYLAADCPWPVEARFMAACIDDDKSDRNWQGPYPFIDVASVLYAAGVDPLGTFSRKENETPAHNPLNDARQSARLLVQALRLTLPKRRL